MDATLDAKIEAILFSEADAVQKSRLKSWLSTTDAALDEAIETLRQRLIGGIALVSTDATVMLAVSPAASATIQSIFETDSTKEIGDAGLEVLSILLYKGPCTRSQIEFIRGVNSSTSVRALVLRGLIERSGNPNDGREYIYRPTAELLAHLGITESGKLPEYDILTRELASFEKANPFNHGTTSDSTESLTSA